MYGNRKNDLYHKNKLITLIYHLSPFYLSFRTGVIQDSVLF